jgi:hypothetical protein
VAVLDPKARGQHAAQPDLTVAILEFSDRPSGESTAADQFSYLDSLLREKASEIRKDALGISWKYDFIAACVRRTRDSMPAVCFDTLAVSDGSNPTRFTLRRWEISAKIINSIVDGLWEAWGSQAALVYKALASQFYVPLETSIQLLTYCQQKMIALALLWRPLWTRCQALYMVLLRTLKRTWRLLHR